MASKEVVGTRNPGSIPFDSLTRSPALNNIHRAKQARTGISVIKPLLMTLEDFNFPSTSFSLSSILADGTALAASSLEKQPINVNISPMANNKKHVFSIDGLEYSSNRATMTPAKILALARLDPAYHYLVRVQGKKRLSFLDTQKEPLRLNDKMTFESVTTGLPSG